MTDKISKNFYRSEFTCPCGCDNGRPVVDAELIKVLEEIREHFGNNPISINSGHRCETYNSTVKGAAPYSQHIREGVAADIIVHKTPANKVQDYLLNRFKDRFGIGCYRSYTHIDVREERARW